MSAEDELRQRLRDDEKLLRRAEKALTEIRVAQGLAESHASVLAALRLRLKGEAGKSLEDLLTAAGDLGSGSIEELLDKPPPPKGSLDEALSKPEKPKR